jgi:hypothetical protein
MAKPTQFQEPEEHLTCHTHEDVDELFNSQVQHLQQTDRQRESRRWKAAMRRLARWQRAQWLASLVSVD